MALLKSLWGIVSGIVALAFVAFVVAPAYGVTLLILHGTSICGREFRHKNSRFMFCWARPTFALFCFLMRIVPVRLQRQHPVFPPALVIANHQSLTDIFVLLTMLPDMGCRDARWVIKKEIARYPLISRVCRNNGSAFIDRADPASAMPRIAAAAACANDDCASLILFPEGTRFVPCDDGYPDPAGGKNYLHVRAPKPGGFLTMRQHMPTQDILLVTIDWGAPVRAKGFLHVGALFGKTCVVRTERYLVPNADAAWLNARWREMETRFDRLRRNGN